MTGVAMPAVHEQVHQGAGQHQQIGPIGKPPGEVGPMLGNQEERCDREERDQGNVSPGLHRANVVRLPAFDSDSSELWTVRSGVTR